MNYTKVPRELIYKDKTSLEDFGIDNPNSLNGELALLMRQYLFFKMRRNDYREIELTIFNEAYYLTTMLLLDDNVIDNYFVYTSSILPQIPYPDELSKTVRRMVVALCYVYLEIPSVESPLLLPVRHLIRQYANEFAYISSEVSRSKHPTSKEFAPVKITEGLLNSINWEKLTDGFKPEKVREFIDYLGQTKKEKRLLIKSMYTQLTNMGIFPIPYSVDSVLLSKYREVGGSTWDFVNVHQEMIKDKNAMDRFIETPDISKLLHDLMTQKKRIQELEKQVRLLEDGNEKLRTQLFNMENEQQRAKTLSQEEQHQRELAFQARIKEMNSIITTMQSKVGNKAIQLKYIVEHIKNKADFVGLKEAYELFETIDSMLCEEHVWIENRHELQDFFRECKKRNSVAPIISGDYVVSKHVDNEVNGVATGATGVNINKK